MAKMNFDDQVALLMQGTEYGDDSLQKAMADELRARLIEADKSGRPLKVYCGFDPRTSDLHLGHTVPMRKMRQFQELGHEVIFVIGRYTSLIGDPSDKDELRPQLTLEETTYNAETYARQAFKILDPDRTRVEYNDTWLSELSFADVIKMASNFTIQQFLTRETFRRRFDEGDPIYVHEFFYALMQAYDAFHLGTDVQIGGSEQLFNIITAGRKLMEAMGAKPNIGILMGILPGTDGDIRMSKSLGNHIALLASPEDMFGKVMSLPDRAMPAYFRMVTRWTPSDIAEREVALRTGDLHPRDAKLQLAHEIVSVYHGEQAAVEAEAAFRKVFQDQGTPDDMPDYAIQPGQTLVDVMVDSGLVSSKSQARRLVKQNGVKLDDVGVEDGDQPIALEAATILRIGKRRFLRLVP
ncbi:MAG: tyrosine--tRNA ligase [Anaerolineales bacterium]|jgi:tyrosyl-tRNA synthetase